MLFYLTNTILDVVWGTTFWILKKTTNGVYYLVWGNEVPQIEGEYDAIIISKEDIENDEKLMKLLNNAKNQEKQIQLLTDNIKELTKIIKNKEKLD